MQVIKPVSYSMEHVYDQHVKIFLAGSIEMGTAQKWQDEVSDILRDCPYYNLLVFNPRRDDWDDTWVQDIENQQFYAQVEWEWKHIHAADIVFICFDPNTKSPITLLELGAVSQMGKLAIVVCPDGFWRKGNVDIVCAKSGIPVYEYMPDAIAALKQFIGALHVRLKPYG